MAEWLDLALIGDEAQLAAAIADLDDDQRDAAFHSLAAALGLEPIPLVNGLIRLLVERVRPLALPARLWNRPNSSSDDPRAMIRAHLERKGVAPTAARVTAASNLYARFVDERTKVPIGLTELVACDFRCTHCGLAFCNEQLEDRGIESPFGNRGRDKVDIRKPHWNSDGKFRLPTHDHIWPVSTYGNNDGGNLQVLCKGCNLGKENVLAVQQAKAWVGLIGRTALLGGTIVEWGTFYAQLREDPVCVESGVGARDAELTVALIDPESPAVLGNLRTVVSPGV